MSLASASDSSDEDEEIFELPPIQPAFVSTKKNIEEFKHEILQGDNGMLKVSITREISSNDDAPRVESSLN